MNSLFFEGVHKGIFLNYKRQAVWEYNLFFCLISPPSPKKIRVMCKAPSS